MTLKRTKKSGKKERFSQARKIYDSFPHKDMTFREFERAYNRELSPNLMKRELNELIRYRGYQRMHRDVATLQRQEIDAKI